jgi:CheY-like chemotaxis protein
MHLTKIQRAVLVAEDNEDIRELVAHQLSRMGIRVLQADNGQAAMDLALAEQPDLVLMDMDMPILSGFDAARQLRMHGYTRPILALTGYSEGPEAKQALSSGCDGLLSKPICSDVLRARVAQALGQGATGAPV